MRHIRTATGAYVFGKEEKCPMWLEECVLADNPGPGEYDLDTLVMTIFLTRTQRLLIHDSFVRVTYFSYMTRIIYMGAIQSYHIREGVVSRGPQH